MRGYVKLIHVPDRSHELYGRTGDIFEVEWEDEKKTRFTMLRKTKLASWVMVTSHRWFEEVLTPPEVSCI